MKATILLAYEAGRMTAVLPFVRLLLEPCMDSKVRCRPALLCFARDACARLKGLEAAA